MNATFDFRIDAASQRAAQASFASLSAALASVEMSDALAERFGALAPGAQTAAGVVRIAHEAFRHGAVTIIEARLVPGDMYLDFTAELLAERSELTVRHDHGWPILSLRPVRAADASGVECLTFDIKAITKATAVDPRKLRLAMAASDAVSKFRGAQGQ